MRSATGCGTHRVLASVGSIGGGCCQSQTRVELPSTGTPSAGYKRCCREPDAEARAVVPPGENAGLVAGVVRGVPTMHRESENPRPPRNVNLPSPTSVVGDTGYTLIRTLSQFWDRLLVGRSGIPTFHARQATPDEHVSCAAPDTAAPPRPSPPGSRYSGQGDAGVRAKITLAANEFFEAWR